MVNDASKPWDVRLIERMSRGSSGLRGSGKWTPKQRAVYGVFSIVWISILVSENSRSGRWWLIALIVVFVAAAQLGTYLWERKRGT